MDIDYMDEDYLKIVIKNLADDFLKSRFNIGVTGDVNLAYKAGLFLRESKLNVKHADRLAKEILLHQQSRVNAQSKTEALMFVTILFYVLFLRQEMNEKKHAMKSKKT